jgi:hypothetical protein
MNTNYQAGPGQHPPQNGQYRPQGQYPPGQGPGQYQQPGVVNQASAAIFTGQDAVPALPPHILQQLDQLAQSWSISRIFKERMPLLYGREFVFLFDDSGSMRNTDRGYPVSRWMELKQFAAQAIALSSAFDSDGVDVYFLNRPTVSGVRHVSQLEQTFQREPTDYDLTPLSAKLDQILIEKREKFARGNCILLIATDGEPRSQDNRDSVQQFVSGLMTRHQRIGLQSPALIPIAIRACTNDINSIGYLNHIDQNQQLFVDVCDDYMQEKNEIQQVLGPDFTFTIGDHCLKVNCILLSVF